jgi:pyridoxine 5-phosphate synthase
MDYVQFNTASLASVEDLGTMNDHIEQIKSAAIAANKLGLGVSVGRGLDYQNIREFKGIALVEEFNIGAAIISRSLLVGIENALRQLRAILKGS